MKKFSYDSVKEYIERFGYLLVSKEYKNSKTKMELICPEGHSFEITYSNFQQNRRCPICAGKQKHSYINVKKYIEVFGYQLVSKEYKNNGTKLELVCSEGHNFEISYSHFQRGHRCSVCYGNKKHSYNHIKQYIEGFGYSLISKEYRNSTTKIKLTCPKSHEFEMCYGNFQQGQRCPECAKFMVTSRGEKEVLNFVQSIYGGRIIENDRTQIINPLTGKYLELDIWLPELNKAIEYNGLFWHCKNNVKYRDNQKQIRCSEKGIELLVIEEKEWMEYKDFKIIKNFIEKGEIKCDLKR